MNCNFDLILKNAYRMVNLKCYNGQRKLCEVLKFYCSSQRQPSILNTAYKFQ
jgi:hypothetical protein